VYLDSCIVIYLTEGSAEMRERINRQLLRSAEAAPIVAFTDLSRLECRVKPLASGNATLLADYDSFFATPGYVKCAIDTATFDVATELRARHSLKTPDALHLAAAIASGCEELWTNDERLTRAADSRIRIVSVDQFA
jgi:predicted nucleic acid-binding protein